MSSKTAIPAELLTDLFIRKWSSTAALAVLLWEFAITLKDEYRVIWRRKLNFVKCVYIFSRYFGLTIQSVNLYLVLGPLSNPNPIPTNICKKWFSLLITSSCLLMAGLDAILMLRVYALHQQSPSVGAFLILLFVAQVVVECIVALYAVLDVPYNAVCDTLETHRAVLYFCASVWIIHLSVAVLTLAKRNLWQLGAPVVRLVTRDGAWILIFICSMFGAIIPHAFVSQASKAHLVFGWPISLISIGCCRMIMNMQTLDFRGEVDPEGSQGSCILTELTEMDTTGSDYLTTRTTTTEEVTDKGSRG